jgi:hypothetical protein
LEGNTDRQNNQNMETEILCGMGINRSRRLRV